MCIRDRHAVSDDVARAEPQHANGCQRLACVTAWTFLANGLEDAFLNTPVSKFQVEYSYAQA
eukprot:11062527-Karenia_brevis.AAC.1